MKEKSGQISLEYLLIFAISLIVLIVFTMPFLEYTMDTTFDVSDSVNVKSDLSKIAHAVKQVYGQGQGSRQTVDLNINKPLKITISNNHVSSSIKLKNGEIKVIKIDVKSKFKSNSFYLKKGIQSLVIEWPVGSENMVIYQK